MNNIIELNQIEYPRRPQGSVNKALAPALPPVQKTVQETVMHTLPTPSDNIIEHPARPIPFEIVENPPTLSEEVRPKGLLLHCV